MVLRTQTDYALRVLLYLAAGNQQAPVEEIAKAYQISKDHLVKVVQQLARFGLVVSRSGRNGGIRLAKDPATIVIGDVVAQFEGRNGVLPCIADQDYCTINRGCSLKGMLIRAEQAFYDVLSKSTIADVVKSHSEKTNSGLAQLTITRAVTASEPNEPVCPATATTKGTTEKS